MNAEKMIVNIFPSMIFFVFIFLIFVKFEFLKIFESDCWVSCSFHFPTFFSFWGREKSVVNSRWICTGKEGVFNPYEQGLLCWSTEGKEDMKLVVFRFRFESVSYWHKEIKLTSCSILKRRRISEIVNLIIQLYTIQLLIILLYYTGVIYIFRLLK